MNFQKFYESLDTKADIDQWEDEFDGDLVTVHFTVVDIEYLMTFATRIDPFDWEISFAPKFADSDFSLLGNVSNPMKVFAAVADILKKFIDKEQPNSFFFSAKEPSRKRLYDRFAKMIDNQTIYNQDIERQKSLENDDEDNNKYYAFTKQ